MKMVMPPLAPFVFARPFSPFRGEFTSSGGPLSVLNVEKLSLSPSSPTDGTTIVAVSDGFVVSGADDNFTASSHKGLHVDSGTTLNSRKVYFLQPPNIDPDFQAQTQYDGTTWRIGSNNDGFINAATGSETNPWEADWSSSGDGTTTLTHPAIQRLVPPDSSQGGVAVIGGTQDEIFVIFETSNGKTYYRDIGGIDDINVRWSSGDVRWEINNFTGDGLLYYSLSDVATPDLASNWKNAADDTPASITVTSVSVGELNAGVTVAGSGNLNLDGSWETNRITNGRRVYDFINYGDIVAGIGWGGSDWRQGDDLLVGINNVAFPWQDDWSGNSPAPTVTRNDVASEANWSNV